MLFNSLAFLVFLPIVWCCYHALRSASARGYLLLAASYIFYMWWRVDYVALLLLSTVVDFVVALAIARSSSKWIRRASLATSITVNLGLLCTFKYWNFLVGELTSLGGIVFPQLHLPTLDLLLPVGISFYTFQTMSYTIEVYRGKMDPESNLASFALYVSFFPQLVAGPIERPQRLLPQIRCPRQVDSTALVSGLRLMLWGMFKKVVVADRLAALVDIAYADPAAHQGMPLLVATVFFSIQIYCDFSGYSDIAIGCARTLGFDLMTNFRRPYLAWSPSEFWRRWHISLSTWFRDYVYVPLGGSRHGRTRTVVSLAATFLISGFWHGANWTFIVWGAIHGFLVVAERMFRRLAGIGPSSKQVSISGRLLGMAFTIPCVVVAWVFFRAESVQSAIYILTHLVTSTTSASMSCGLGREYILMSAVLIAVVLGYDICEESRGWRTERSLWDLLPTPLRWCGYWSVATSILLIGELGGATQFLYFQF